MRRVMNYYGLDSMIIIVLDYGSQGLDVCFILLPTKKSAGA